MTPSDSAMKEAEKIFDRCYCYDLKDDPENWPCQTCRIAQALDRFAEKATRRAAEVARDIEKDIEPQITANAILQDAGLTDTTHHYCKEPDCKGDH